ncbi:hypothetical protein FE249_00820 [Acidiphilium multivorum]|uniref:hypothetical protein n=1 Tax=Acidiphilium multivorum TaxID=62140 RepID=UPI001F4C1D06|nr:hypothetical protein [Acidiphilium multivorum]UNC12870.1 hypothetical protein FE249_00820 [Acidiphilium multivorum]
MRIPGIWTAGDTVTWVDRATRDPQGNPITPGAWSLTYSLRGPGSLDIESTDIEGGWQLVAAGADTTTLAAGRYDWQCTAKSAADGTLVTIGRGQVFLQPNLAGVQAPYDGRSQAKQIVDAIDAEMLRRTQGGAAVEFSIAGRSLRKHTVKEMIQLRSYYLEVYAREVRAERIKQGLGDPGARFAVFRPSNSPWPNGNW